MKQFSIVVIIIGRIWFLVISAFFLVACSKGSYQERDLIPSTSEPVAPPTKTVVPGESQYKELFEEARLNGDVAVVVEFDLSHWQENSSESISNDEAITFAREAVLMELDRPEVEAVVYREFHVFPYLALRVNEEGLQILQDSEFVKTLKPDQATSFP